MMQKSFLVLFILSLLTCYGCTQGDTKDDTQKEAEDETQEGDKEEEKATNVDKMDTTISTYSYVNNIANDKEEDKEEDKDSADNFRNYYSFVTDTKYKVAEDIVIDATTTEPDKVGSSKGDEESEGEGNSEEE